ncbi:MAG: PQQ-like beta-propeller repeat protein [Verrucomicrobia bacterium]|nr:PQQ-like beta-propeller repeat protein [Verrucomicrobiota bacterium]
MKFALARLLLCACLVSPPRLHAAADGEDWPQFLGPRGDNTSRETGLLDKFPAAGPRVVWSKQIGTGYSAPSVRGPQLVLHHRLGNEEIIGSFDAATGRAGWRHSYPCQYRDPYGYNNGPRCTPLLTEDRCYAFGVEGRLVCLDLKTGKLIWERDTAKDFAVPEAFFGVGSTPILEDGRLIVMVGGQPNSGIVAFDAATGKAIWESVGKKNWDGVPMLGWPGDRKYQWSGAEKSASYSSPVAATIHGQRHVFAVMRQGLVSLNPTNGAVNFSRWFQSVGSDSVNGIRPVVVGDLVFVSAAYYRAGSFLLCVKPGGKSFEEVWCQPKFYQERDANGALVNPVLGIHWNTPVLHDGHLYAFDGRNEPDALFKCVELKTARLKWARDERWPAHSSPQPKVYGRGSAVMADGKLIVLGEGGLLGLFKVNPEKAEELARWQVPDLRYPCWAAPVLSRKKVYLRSEDRLVCVDFAK